VRRKEAALGQLVDVGDGLVVERLHLVRVLVWRDQPGLRMGDLGVDPPRGKALRFAFELLEALLHEPDLVGLVVDGEVRAVAEPLSLAAEDPAAGGMEGEEAEPLYGPAEETLQALPHLPGRLVREGDGEDLARLRTDRVDQVCDAVGEDARLARTCTHDHQQRAFRGKNGLPLSGIQVCEVLLGRGDGHGSMLARPFPVSRGAAVPSLSYGATTGTRRDRSQSATGQTVSNGPGVRVESVTSLPLTDGSTTTRLPPRAARTHDRGTGGRDLGRLGGARRSLRGPRRRGPLSLRPLRLRLRREPAGARRLVDDRRARGSDDEARARHARLPGDVPSP